MLLKNNKPFEVEVLWQELRWKLCQQDMNTFVHYSVIRDGLHPVGYKTQLKILRCGLQHEARLCLVLLLPLGKEFACSVQPFTLPGLLDQVPNSDLGLRWERSTRIATNTVWSHL
jgi:hypothetical protein